jgi:hypothetical protein
VDRRRFLGLVAAAAGAALIGPRLARVAGAQAAGWSSPEIQRRYHYGLGTAGDFALIAGGQGYDAAQKSFDSDQVDLFDGRSGTWSTAQLSVPRQDPTVASAGPVGLVIGGRHENKMTDALDVFDATTQTWSPARLSEARSQPAIVTLTTKIVMVGSQYQPQVRTLDVFDTVSGAVTPVQAPVSEGFRGWSAVGGGSTVLLLEETGKPIDHVYRFDAEAGEGAPVLLTQARHSAKAYVFGDRVLIANSVTPDVATMDAMDLATGQVTAMALPRPGIEPIEVDGDTGTRLLFQTRQTTETTVADSSRFDMFDTAQDRWSVVTLPRPRRFARVAVLGDTLYFVGGVDDTGNPMSDLVDICDVGSDRWKAAKLSVPRSSFGVATIGDRVLFAGGSVAGQSRTAKTHFDVVDIFDPNGPVGTGQLAKARETPEVAVVGKYVVFVGGVLGCTSCPISTLASDVDVYDSSAG